MSDRSKIEWTDASWNPVVGCQQISPGCKNCYAMRMAGRIARMGDGDTHRAYRQVVTSVETGEIEPAWNGTVRAVVGAMTKPLRWKKPRRIFVCSMSDLFHDDVGDWLIDSVLAVAAQCPQHTFQILTKRPDRAAEYFRDLETLADQHAEEVGSERFTATSLLNLRWLTRMKHIGTAFGEVPWPLPNVWLGTSVENQQFAERRIPHLIDCPAAVRFLSAEPLLGPINFESIGNALFDRSRAVRKAMAGPTALNHDQADSMIATCEIDWVVVGGESGSRARACYVDWIRSIRDQCKLAHVPVFIKQLGSRPQISRVDYATRVWNDSMIDDKNITLAVLGDRKGGDMTEWPEDLRVREFPEVTPCAT